MAELPQCHTKWRELLQVIDETGDEARLKHLDAHPDVRKANTRLHYKMNPSMLADTRLPTTGGFPGVRLVAPAIDEAAPW